MLGILAVNIAHFAWPMDLALDPTLAPFDVGQGPDKIGQWLSDTFFADKARPLFALLFGVSVYLVGGEIGEGDNRLGRRLRWLAAFGLIHGLLIWYGDILLLYALCGLVLATMRSMAVRRLLLIGGGVTLALALAQAALTLMIAALPPELQAEMGDSGAMTSAADLQASLHAYRSGWGGVLMENAGTWLLVQGFSLVYAPAILLLMMLGLGLFKSGWLLGRAPTWTYAATALCGGLFLAALGWAGWIDQSNGPAPSAAGVVHETLKAFAPLATLGYAAVIILAATRGPRLIAAILAPVGRMAFTNYLSQSLILASLFYWPGGLHWMGQMGPAEWWRVVLAVWALQLLWSPLWLHFFRYGPFEWMWRSLVAGSPSPFRRRPA